MSVRTKSRRGTLLFAVTLVIGLILIGAGCALEQYYKANIADKNGDGVKDWKDIDINGDGKVDMRDIYAIVLHTGQPTTADTDKYDINGDGFIDKTDAELAAQFFGEGLSVLNLYTNQGKVFTTGIILTILSVIGLVVTKIRY
jgi:hypothetical protein